ncbi:carboxylating nicotinate-nucleotide diphosphorylase [Fictibacillus phosphorivorans]|uniref:carboxylating nicotinate-nucleotide diphosphorylase n=1 Tax=Fictibacillus phosphorivorans TaxID=1221500 RepID=UPI00203B57E5|nr:carboxylating nicotinate-nucleotide diphosphorylase [Fictibacillus phosphorivorans]MCM3716995.1 carboxylating nicotinate-nucleotide diphosphorylase [Fictibacillus phosphorivorans]MCM3774456.1 carboxylating nicotinate-nucleotide diphosphorylase [Fictibacillus phosphorivorans]
MNQLLLKKQLQEFLIEDIGTGDLSADLFNDETEISASIVSKESGLFAGYEVLNLGYGLIDPSIQTSIYVKDGDYIEQGMVLAEIRGSRTSILKGERVLLNLLQRLSGIASVTAKAVSLAKGRTRICDTRKTTPGLRMLEKYAVRCGGGYNHRFGLYDTVMLKDNHLAGFSSIQDAIETARKKLGHTVKIEVETETENQVIEAVSAGADIIMFDNCTPEEISQRLRYVPERIVTEASGGIELDDIDSYARTGVQYISLGFLTHSNKALDISLNVKGAVKA